MFILFKNDYKIDREKEVDAVSDQQITKNWIDAVVNKGYETGLSQDKRRIFTLIEKKMDDAVEANADYLEVNAVEYQFIKDAFEKAIMDPRFAVPVTIVEKSVLDATDTLPE